MVSQDTHVAGVQIDILAFDANQCLQIVEVKSGGSMSRGIIGRLQKKRLQRAANKLSQDQPVELSVVVVDSLNIWLFESVDL